MVHIAPKLMAEHTKNGKPTFSFEYFVPKTAQVCISCSIMPLCQWLVTDIFSSVGCPKSLRPYVNSIVAHGDQEISWDNCANGSLID